MMCYRDPTKRTVRTSCPINHALNPQLFNFVQSTHHEKHIGSFHNSRHVARSWTNWECHNLTKRRTICSTFILVLFYAQKSVRTVRIIAALKLTAKTAYNKVKKIITDQYCQNEQQEYLKLLLTQIVSVLKILQ